MLQLLAPAFRGRITPNAPLAPYTWFRVGGPAEWLVSPADEDDLSYLLSRLPDEIPVIVIGVGVLALFISDRSFFEFFLASFGAWFEAL